MALINCPECGNEVSDQAESCPECGNPISEDDSENNGGNKTAIGCLLVIGIIIFISYMMAGTGEKATDSSGSNDSISLPDYEVVQIDDLSYGRDNNIKRYRYNVYVKEKAKPKQLKKVAKMIINKAKQENPFNAITVGFRPYEGTSAPFQGQVRYAPNGDWGEAGNVTTGDYDSMQYEYQNLTTIKPGEKEVRFGLTVDQRQKIYKKIAKAEDKAVQKADERFGRSDASEERIQYERELMRKRKKAIAKKHNLTMDQLKKIGVEGVKEGWPGPKLPSK